MSFSHNVSSFPYWSSSAVPPGSQHNFSLATCRHSAAGQPIHSVSQEFQPETDPGESIKAAVQLLLKLGLSRRQIRHLSQLGYRNAINCLADTSEDELDDVVDNLRASQSQFPPRPESGRLSYQALPRYPSGTPSLVTNRSSLSDSTVPNVRLSADITTTCGPDTIGVLPYGPPWNFGTDDRHAEYADIHKEHNLYSMPRIHEGQKLCDLLRPAAPADKFDLDLGADEVPRPIQTKVWTSNSIPRTNEQVVSNHGSFSGYEFVQEEERPQVQNKKSPFPCSEVGCAKEFLNEHEFAKHLTGDHDKDATFACKHGDCPLHPFSKTRPEMCTKHHSTHHRGCPLKPLHDTCIEEIRTRERRYWACGICGDLFIDVKSYAKHYKNHFFEGSYEQGDNDFSTIIRSLLGQGATVDKWAKRNVDVRDVKGFFRLTWEPETCAGIREALEYCTFQGRSLIEPEAVDLLLDEVVARAKQHRKRPASASPVLEPTTPLANQSFQNRVRSGQSHAQVRAVTAIALANLDASDECMGARQLAWGSAYPYPLG